jgi:hypothetical protein
MQSVELENIDYRVDAVDTKAFLRTFELDCILEKDLRQTLCLAHHSVWMHLFDSGRWVKVIEV